MICTPDSAARHSKTTRPWMRTGKARIRVPIEPQVSLGFDSFRGSVSLLLASSVRVDVDFFELRTKITI